MLHDFQFEDVEYRRQQVHLDDENEKKKKQASFAAKNASSGAAIGAIHGFSKEGTMVNDKTIRKNASFHMGETPI